MKKLNTKAGFTLAELLIVVAIIAVLVAIAIPVFSSQLEKSRESTDAANVRTAYAEIMVSILEHPETAISASDTTNKYNIDELKQGQDDWQNTDVKENLESLERAGDATTGELKVEISGTPVVGKGVTFDYAIGTSGTSATPPTLTITFVQKS